MGLFIFTRDYFFSIFIDEAPTVCRLYSCQSFRKATGLFIFTSDNLFAIFNDEAPTFCRFYSC